MDEERPALAVSLRRDQLISLGVACLLAILFLPSLLSVYGHSDDYPRLLVHLLDLRSFRDAELTLGGRPVSTLLIQAGFSSIEDVAHLSLLRGLSLFFWIILATLVHRICRSHGLSRGLSTVMTVFICISPAMVVFLGWASTFPYPLGAACAILAGQLSSQDKSSPIVPISLIWLSLGIYQPVAAYFWIPVILRFWRMPSPRVKDLIPPLVRYGVSLGLYWMALSLFWVLQPGTEGISQRVGLLQSWPDKVHYLSTVLLPDITGGWLVFLNPWMGAFVILAVALRFAKLPRKDILPLALLTIMALGFAVLPALISTENLRGFRLEGPAQAILWMFLIPFGKRLSGAVTPQMACRVYWPAAAALTALAGYAAAWWGIALPQGEQWNRQQGLLSANAYQKAPFVVYRTPLKRHVNGFWSRHEFGLISPGLPWVCGSMLPLSVVSANPDMPVNERMDIYLSDKTIPWPAWQPYPTDVPVIDGKEGLFGSPMPGPRAFKTQSWKNPPALEKTVETYGKLRVLHDNWYYAPAVGPLRIIPGKPVHAPAGQGS